MSTKDQLLYSALHGTAMRYAAKRHSLDESIEELREIADGRNDILAEAAGITAGYWYASPATHVGHELIGAGMLILAGGGQNSRSTMTSWNAGHASGSSGECGHARGSGERTNCASTVRRMACPPLASVLAICQSQTSRSQRSNGF